jgi:hypothetical protein
MSFLGDLLGAPNIATVLASSSTSSAGGKIVISAPALSRKKSGYFDLKATVAATSPGGGTQGILLQLVSSLTGNVGPAMPYYGTSAAGGVVWIDNASVSLLVGQPIQYSVKVTAISGSNSIAVSAGAAALVVSEAGGPTPPQ